MRAAFGVGPDTTAQLLVTAGGNPDRLRTEASFAALCGVAPVPASSGRTNRHRLSRGGDRGANSALYRIALVRMSSEPAPANTSPGRPPPDARRRRSSACSSGRSPGRSSATSPHRSPSRTSPTSDPHARPRTSLSPPSPNTSVSGLR
ncbi:transposase [Streptomyces hydrogenans]|uniref:transposase n=1 Tax=Streptomyces hydrogenans TaxID=1873719 RepID=UPI003819A207